MNCGENQFSAFRRASKINVLTVLATALLLGRASAEPADSYIRSLTITPNAFIAGSTVELRADLKQFSSFLYHGIFWQVSFDGSSFQSVGNSRQLGGDFSLTYVFNFKVPSAPFLLRAGIVTESFVVPGSTYTEYTSAVQVNPLTSDQPGSIGFGVDTGTVSEGIGSVTVQVSRSGGVHGTVGVTYNVVGGTATQGQDFTATTGTLTFGENETLKTFTLSITDDSLVEGNETFSIVLSQPTGGASLGAISTLGVTLQDNDFGKATIIAAGVAPSAGGTVTGAGNYVSGALVKLTATPNHGFSFKNWTENGVEVSLSQNLTFSATTSRNLTANFLPDAPASPPSLTFPKRQPEGSWIFNLLGTTGQNYRVLKSTNLRDWETLARMPGAAVVPIVDLNPGGKVGFYRAIIE